MSHPSSHYGLTLHKTTWNRTSHTVTFLLWSRSSNHCPPWGPSVNVSLFFNCFCLMSVPVAPPSGYIRWKKLIEVEMKGIFDVDLWESESVFRVGEQTPPPQTCSDVSPSDGAEGGGDRVKTGQRPGGGTGNTDVLEQQQQFSRTSWSSRSLGRTS